MTPLAASGLLQKSPSICLASRASRVRVLPATSKRVPELGESGAQFVGPAAEIGVHQSPRAGDVVPSTLLDSSIAKTVQAVQRSRDAKASERSAALTIITPGTLHEQ